ncbi:MAG: hypothetical protein H7838_05440, partial [Magnetococcus sp. DMHC-8]
MTMRIVIDGLAEEAAVPALLPLLDRLAMAGRGGRVRLPGDPRFALLGRGEGGQARPDRDLPLGYATALASVDQAGDDWPDPARIWCCLGFTHLHARQNDLLFLSAERTGQARAEHDELVEALLPDLREAGWELHAPSRQGFGAGPGGRAVAVLSRAAGLEPP